MLGYFGQYFKGIECWYPALAEMVRWLELEGKGSLQGRSEWLDVTGRRHLVARKRMAKKEFEEERNVAWARNSEEECGGSKKQNVPKHHRLTIHDLASGNILLLNCSNLTKLSVSSPWGLAQNGEVLGGNLRGQKYELRYSTLEYDYVLQIWIQQSRLE